MTCVLPNHVAALIKKTAVLDWHCNCAIPVGYMNHCNYARFEVFQKMLDYLGILSYDAVPIGKQIPPFW